MPRPSRHAVPATVHHVMNRGVDRQPVFRADSDRIDFGHQLAACHERFGIELFAYCLMDNHFHLVVHTPDGGLSEAMHLLGTRFVRHANDRIGRDGPMFRGRFHALPVNSDAYLRDLVRYVHRNPLDIAGVTSPADYRWSSYRSYLGFRAVPPFLDIRRVMSYFGDDAKALARYTEGSPGSAEPPRFGSEEITGIVRREIAAERLLVEPDVPVPRERTVAALLLDHGDTAVRTAAGQLTRFPSDAARRMAQSRSRRRLETDETLRRVLTRVQAAVEAA